MRLTDFELVAIADTAALPHLVKANLFVSAAFLVTAFLLFLFIVLSRYRDSVKLRKQKILEELAQQYITSYLFDDEEEKLSPNTFRKELLTNSFKRQVFLNSLILLHKNIIGETSEQLRVLYKDLGLQQHSKQKLYSSQWNKIAEGICELTEIGTQQDVGLIRSFINHSQPILRSEAQAALVRLDRDKPFSFLDELAEPLQDWQQMQLARAAQKAHLANVPDFTRWLVKKEQSIVVFSIRMIVLYNQHQASSALLDLLHHTAPVVRREVIVALRQLEAFEAAEKLMEIYPHETPENKKEILSTLPAITFEETFAAYQKSIAETEVKQIQPEVFTAQTEID